MLKNETQQRLDYLIANYKIVDGNKLKKITPPVREVTKGWPSNGGYMSIMIQNKVIPFHRALFALYYGRWPECCIDHIDSDRSNNHISNLREATYAENLHNKKGKQKYHYDAYTGKYRSSIQKAGKIYRSPRFYEAQSAIDWYEDKARELYGEFATY